MPGTVHATAEAVSAAGGRALAVGCDISRDGDIARLIGRTIDEYGRVDILVNNAMSPLRGRFEDTDVSVWDAAIATNIRSLLVLCQSVLPHMMRQGGGSIINISSGGAEHASTPYLPPGFAIYAMAKAAMERFTTASAPELAERGVAINALRPGAVKTELAVHELGEDNDWSSWTTPDAVVPAVVFLAAERGDGFTGRIVDSPRFGKDWP